MWTFCNNPHRATSLPGVFVDLPERFGLAWHVETIDVDRHA